MPVCPQENALPQGVHIIEVLFPEAVHHAQHQHSRQLLHAGLLSLTEGSDLFRRFVFKLLFPVQGFGNSCHHLLGNFFPSPPFPVYILGIQKNREREIEPVQEVAEIPLLPVHIFGEIKRHLFLYDLPEQVAQCPLRVICAKYLFAKFVDHLALLVHYIIVLKRVLADCEVPLLYPLLGCFD